MALAEAFAMDAVWADALAIAFGEMAGRTWDWGARSWAEGK